MLNKTFLGLLAVSAVLFVSGCGQKLPDGMPKLFSTKVVVKYADGTGVPGATVLLIPNDSSVKDWSSGGTTGEDGSIDLFTRGQYKGVPAGSYKVTVKKLATENTEPVEAELDAESYKKALQQYNNPSGPDPMVNYALIDPTFANPESTTLELTVEAKNGNVLDVNVGDKIKVVP